MRDQQRLVLQLWRRSCKDRPYYPQESPQIIGIDFEGVRSITEETVSDVLMFSLALYRGSPFSSYAYLDNLPNENVYRTISHAFVAKNKPDFVVAVFKGQQAYHVIGNGENAAKFNSVWQSLHVESSWVTGHEFSQHVLPNERPNSTLNKMAELGVVIKTTRSSIPYFKTVI